MALELEPSAQLAIEGVLRLSRAIPLEALLQQQQRDGAAGPAPAPGGSGEGQEMGLQKEPGKEGSGGAGSVAGGEAAAAGEATAAATREAIDEAKVRGAARRSRVSDDAGDAAAADI